jgi:hypothetical protein
MNQPLMTESEFLEELRRKFRGEGYKELSSTEVAAELHGQKPDLVVKRGDEVIVVEVKSRLTPKSDRQLRKLKELVEQREHWCFRFMVVPQRPAAPPDEDDVERAAKWLQQSKQVGRAEPALAAILLWVAMETFMRRILTLRQQRPLYGTWGLSLARRLRDLGVLDDDDLEVMEPGKRARDLAVHGYVLPPRFVATSRLYALAEELQQLAEIGRQPGGRGRSRAAAMSAIRPQRRAGQ